jgi:uncharacterized protein YcaQ
VRAEPSPQGSLSIDEARRIVLHAQGFVAGESTPRTVPAILHRLGAVQLDTVSVLARSHELVAYARLGAMARAEVEAAYWSSPPRTFEYWAHANCILPMQAWPYFAFRRRTRRATTAGWIKPESEASTDEVLARLRAGPLTTADVGGARASPAGWWNWSEAKRALEWLYYRGEVVCTNRIGWRRVYDLPERTIPPALLANEPDDEECYAYLVEAAMTGLGVGTRRDIAAYFQLTGPSRSAPLNARALIDGAIEAARLVPVNVEGWSEVAYAREETLSRPVEGECRSVLLSPFDSLVWAPSRRHRRTERLFNFTYQTELYLPKEKRTHGYFVMPLLANCRIAGRADPVRRGKTLVASRVSLDDPEAAPAMAEALREAATWVGCDSVVVESASPRGILDGYSL